MVTQISAADPTERVATAAPKCLLVLTRDLGEAGGSSGRERMLAQIRETVVSGCELMEFRIRNLFEQPSIIASGAAALHWLVKLLVCKPLPLQVALFFNRRQIRALVELVTETQPDSIYFDGVRSLEYLLAVQRACPHVKLVCDFDDLMSRRMEMLSAARLGLSAGYLSSWVPAWVKDHILRGACGQLITRYERRALLRAELRILDSVHCAILLSKSDAELLRRRAHGARAERIRVIPPSTPILRPIGHPAAPLRFVFVGSDVLTQNRLTIEWLLEAWRTWRPTTPLHIYGRMERSYAASAHLFFEGFAESLDDIYTPQSILIAPAFVGGGVKTKVLEAIAHGTIVIGNEATFEGLGFDAEGLIRTKDEIRAIVLSPEEHLPALTAAAARLQDACRIWLDPELVRASWLQVVQPHP